MGLVFMSSIVGEITLPVGAPVNYTPAQIEEISLEILEQLTVGQLDIFDMEG